MKKSILLSVCVLMLGVSYAQNNLTVSSMVGTSVETVLQQHLAGEGVLLSGCPYPGINSSFQPGKFNNLSGNVQSAQLGTFNRNNSSFPFQTGIIMTTGNVSVAAGPNSGGGSSSQVGVVNYTDPTLSNMMSGLEHCAALEFDFVAAADTFAFNYIFASEEYPEFACSSFNDVFAFFLSGPDPLNPTGAMVNRNVAIIPNTISSNYPNGIPVTINSINSGPGPSYSSSGCTPPNTSGLYSSFYVGNPSGVEYDGHTVALTAAATILACQNYHMKMAIGNVTDNGYDSGVFLEEGSFYSPSVQIEQVWDTDEGGDTLQTDRELDILFKLPRPALTGFTDILFNTTGDAVLGQDYSLVMQNGMEITDMNNMFTFQPGDTVQQVHVKILPTVLFDPDMPVKTVILYVSQQGCSSTQYMEGFQPQQDTIVLHLRMSGTGIEEISKEKMHIFPNPAKQYLQVDLGMPVTDVRALELVNSDGQVVRKITVSDISFRIDTSSLPSGMYFIHADTKNGKISLPFVKQ